MKKLLIICFIAMSVNGLCKNIDEAIVDAACKKYKATNCTLIHAMVWTESNYRSVTVMDTNDKRSYGPMQVQCETARKVGLKFACDQMEKEPLIGLRFGIKYIERHLKKYSDIKDAIASYNAGKVYICRKIRFDDRGRVMCYAGEYVNYNYVNKVMRRYNHLNNINNSKDI